MTRIGPIFADLSAKSVIIRADPPDLRYPRSISSNLTLCGRNGLAAAFYCNCPGQRKLAHKKLQVKDTTVDASAPRGPHGTQKTAH